VRTAHDPKIDRLARLHPFADLPRRQLARVSALADEVERPAGTVLAHQGDHGGEAFVVAEGTVAVVREGEDLAVLGSGEVLGELALLDHTRRSADVVARTPVRLLVFGVRDFQQLLDAFPGMAARIRAAADGRRGATTTPA
jgi:CRP/FNR family cyclic AMP-dependent transcriptional regulator